MSLNLSKSVSLCASQCLFLLFLFLRHEFLLYLYPSMCLIAHSLAAGKRSQKSCLCLDGLMALFVGRGGRRIPSSLPMGRWESAGPRLGDYAGDKTAPDCVHHHLLELRIPTYLDSGCSSSRLSVHLSPFPLSQILCLFFHDSFSLCLFFLLAFLSLPLSHFLPMTLLLLM